MLMDVCQHILPGTQHGPRRNRGRGPCTVADAQAGSAFSNSGVSCCTA